MRTSALALLLLAAWTSSQACSADLSAKPPPVREQGDRVTSEGSITEPTNSQPTGHVRQPAATETLGQGPSEPHVITILYDNHRHDPRLETVWGFAALMESGGRTVLFDTGGDGAILLRNMQRMAVDPSGIDVVVLSHAHGDHIGGMDALFSAGARPTVYMPPAFPERIKAQTRERTEVIEISPWMTIAEGLFTTGEIAGTPPEQALVVRREEGLVILTGCAHPGVTNIIRQATDEFGQHVHLVLGGFHLGDWSVGELNTLLAEFRELGVERVAPCHCTGDQAIAAFRQEYSEDFIEVGAGSVIRIGDD